MQCRLKDINMVIYGRSSAIEAKDAMEQNDYRRTVLDKEE